MRAFAIVAACALGACSVGGCSKVLGIGDWPNPKEHEGGDIETDSGNPGESDGASGDSPMGSNGDDVDNESPDALAEAGETADANEEAGESDSGDSDSATGCTPNTQQCASGSAVETCGADRQWGDTWPCATGTCSGSACTGSTTGAANLSCATSGAGVSNCGAGGSGSESCCTSLEVPGGRYDRSYDGVDYSDKSYPATISGLRLDKYLVTVGRFRRFVDAVVGGWVPAAAAGEHAHLNGGKGLSATGGGYEPGWDASDWNGLLATTRTAWNTRLACDPTQETWTPSVGANDNKAINCATWHEAYAFCIWDGGFLPSEAEWNYAAAGGGGKTGQRVFAWSSPPTNSTLDCTHANYYGCPANGVNDVGSESPVGDGAFGQTDLTGNVWEWNVDKFANYVTPCANCANFDASASNRVYRGGGFMDATPTLDLVVSYRFGFPPADRINDIGFRCARTP
jgi:formylglycine-generating enzyme required for sulfatase activity